MNLSDREVSMFLGVVRNTFSEDHPGMIEVILFPEFINFNQNQIIDEEKDGTSNGRMWMPYMTHADVNGYGFHLSPKAGDTVVVVSFGTSNATTFAMANFWSLGVSPFTQNKKFRESGDFTIRYLSVNPDVKYDELVKEHGADGSPVRLVEKSVSKITQNPDRKAKDLIENIYSFNTLYYRFLIDETGFDEDGNETNEYRAVISSMNGDSIIEMSTKGIFIYNKNNVSIISGGDMTVASGGELNFEAKHITMIAKENMHIGAGMNLAFTAAEDLHAAGKKIFLNKKQDIAEIKHSTLSKVQPKGGGGGGGEGAAELIMNLTIPYPDEQEECAVLSKEATLYADTGFYAKDKSKSSLAFSPFNTDTKDVGTFAKNSPAAKDLEDGNGDIWKSIYDALFKEIKVEIKPNKKENNTDSDEINVILDVKMNDLSQIPGFGRKGRPKTKIKGYKPSEGDYFKLNFPIKSGNNPETYLISQSIANPPKFVYNKKLGSLGITVDVKPRNLKVNQQLVEFANSGTPANASTLRADSEAYVNLRNSQFGSGSSTSTTPNANSKPVPPSPPPSNNRTYVPFTDMMFDDQIIIDFLAAQSASGGDVETLYDIAKEIIVIPVDGFGTKFTATGSVDEKKAGQLGMLKIDDDSVYVGINYNFARYVVDYPNIQFVRRAPAWSRLGLSDGPANTCTTLVYDQVNRQYMTELNGAVYPNDATDPATLETYRTGDPEKRRKLIDDLRGTDSTPPLTTSGQPLPFFNFFFDKVRTLGNDSFVRIFNNFMYTDPQTIGIPELDDVYHDAKGEEEYCPREKHIPFLGFTNASKGKSYYSIANGDGVMPIRNDGQTLVVEVADQAMPAWVLPLLGAPLVGLYAAKKWGKKGGEETDLFIGDRTEEFTRSFDNKIIGKLADEKEAPVSNYYFGTNVVFECFCEKQKNKNNEIVYDILSVSSGMSPIYTSNPSNSDHRLKIGDSKRSLKDFRGSGYILPLGDYAIKATKVKKKNNKYERDESEVVYFFFSIVSPDSSLAIKDVTSADDDNNKALLTKNYGKISSIEGGMFSRYRSGTHISVNSLFNINSKSRLGSVDGVSQQWSVLLFNSEDAKYENPVWQSDSFSFDKEGYDKIDLVDKDSNWIVLEPKDYILLARGVSSYGDAQVPSESKLVLSIKNSLLLSDKTEKTTETAPSPGHYQAIVTGGKDISGPIISQTSENNYYKGANYYVEDFENLLIYLQYADKEEHKFKKILTEVSTGDVIELGSDDEWDAESNSYKLDLKGDVKEGYYKLTCVDENDEEIFDDILFRLYSKARIYINVSSNSTVRENTTIRSIATSISVLFSYSSTLTEKVNISSYVKMVKDDNSVEYKNAILTISGEGVESSGTKFSDDNIANNPTYKISPNIPLSFTYIDGVDGEYPLNNVKELEFYIINADNTSITEVRKIGIIKQVEGGSDDTNVKYSKRASVKKK